MIGVCINIITENNKHKQLDINTGKQRHGEEDIKTLINITHNLTRNIYSDLKNRQSNWCKEIRSVEPTNNVKGKNIRYIERERVLTDGKNVSTIRKKKYLHWLFIRPVFCYHYFLMMKRDETSLLHTWSGRT